MFECRVDPVEKQLLPYCGMPVCLFMKDGSRIVGRMTACRNGAVILNGDGRKPAATASRNIAGRRAKRTRVQSRDREPQPPAIAPFAPLSLEPLSWDTAKPDQVSLRTIESVLIL